MVIQRIGGTTATPQVSTGGIQRINVGPALQKPTPTVEPIQITPTQKKIDWKQIGSKAKDIGLTVLKTITNFIPPVTAYKITKAMQTEEGRKEFNKKANEVWKFLSPEPLMGLEPGTLKAKSVKTPEGRKDIARGISTLMSGMGFATLPSAATISQLQPLPGLVIKNIAIGGGISLGISAGVTALAGEKQNWWRNASATLVGMYFGAMIPEKQITMKQAEITDATSTLKKYGISNNKDYRKFTLKNHPDKFSEALRPPQREIMTEVNNAIADLQKNSLSIKGAILKPPLTVNGMIQWAEDAWTKIINPPSKTGRAIVPYKGTTPIENIIPVGEYTASEIVGKVIGNKLEKSAEGKQIVKLAIDAQKLEQNIVVESAVEAKVAKVELPVPKGVEKPQISAIGVEKGRGVVPQAQKVTQPIVGEGGGEGKLKTKKEFTSTEGVSLKSMAEGERKIDELLGTGGALTGNWKADYFYREKYISEVMAQAPKEIVFEVQKIQNAIAEFKNARQIVEESKKISVNEVKEIVLKAQEIFKTITVNKDQLPIGEGKIKASKLESRLKGVVGEATPEQISQLGLSTYNVMNKADQIAKASEYVVNHQQEALDVLQGKIEPPKGIIPESIYVALTELAKDDITLATKLTTLQATALGQRIGILSEIDKDNPVKLLNEVYKVREAEFKKRTGKTVKEAVKSEVEKIKKSIKVSDKYDWNTFIDSIPTC